MNKKGRNRKGVMYSTNRDFEYEYENDEMETLPNNEQNLKVCIDKHRAGKIAVIIPLSTMKTIMSFGGLLWRRVIEGGVPATIWCGTGPLTGREKRWRVES